MDIEKIAREANLSFRRVRLVVSLLRKYGYLPPDDKLDDVKRMKTYINHGQGLSVQQLVDLIEKPDLLRALGVKAAAARAEIRALGDVRSPELPLYIPAYVAGASRGDPEAAEQLATWVKSVMPEHNTTFQYFGVRIVLGTPDQSRADVQRRLHRAFLAVQKLKSFEGWFHVVDAKGRRKTIYHRPM